VLPELNDDIQKLDKPKNMVVQKLSKQAKGVPLATITGKKPNEPRPFLAYASETGEIYPPTTNSFLPFIFT
jgi:hypothetical protein